MDQLSPIMTPLPWYC